VYSILSSPRRNKQTMTGRMDDWTDVKHLFIHMSRHCRALACVPPLPIVFFATSHLYSIHSPPRRSKQTMTRWMDDRMNGRMDVWISCLMHKCVCIWRYILQNYNYKLHSKTFLYMTFRMYPSRPWLLKILMFALLVTHEITTYSWPWE